MKIAHLSDLHFGFSPGLDSFIERRLHEVCEAGADHLVISGDLSQSGRKEQWEGLRHLLRRYGFFTPEALTVIPGNHDLFSFFFSHFHATIDFYAKLHRVPGTAIRIYRYGWQQYERDLACFNAEFNYFSHLFTLEDAPAGGYPFIKILNEKVALIGLDSNRLLPQIRRNAICSNGYVDLTSTRHILAHPQLHDKIKLVLLHHHLLPEKILAGREGRWFASATRLLNRKEVVALLAQAGVDLVLHGHYHHQESYRLANTLRVLNNGDCRKWSLIEIRDGKIDLLSQPAPLVEMRFNEEPMNRSV